MNRALKRVLSLGLAKPSSSLLFSLLVVISSQQGMVVLKGKRGRGPWRRSGWGVAVVKASRWGQLQSSLPRDESQLSLSLYLLSGRRVMPAQSVALFPNRNTAGRCVEAHQPQAAVGVGVHSAGITELGLTAPDPDPRSPHAHALLFDWLFLHKQGSGVDECLELPTC